MAYRRGLAATALAAAVALAGCGAPEPTDPLADAPSLSGPPTVAETTPSAQAPRPTESTTTAPAPRPKRTRSGVRRAKPPRAPKYLFPVISSNASYHPTHSKYPATDIFAACGSPVVAVTDGVVLEVSRTDTYVAGRPDGPANGGLYVSLLGDDGVRYYGSHLTHVAEGINAGVRVRAGQQVGSVGKTGNASNVCHLHFGISPPCGRVGDWKVRRGVVWPAPYLNAWRRGQSDTPVDKVDAWRRAHNCRA